MRLLSRTAASVLPLVSALSAPTAAAATAGRFGAPAAVLREPVSAGGGVAQVVFSLAIVLAAIVALGWVARRLRTMPRGRSGVLRVVDEVALGAKERAVVLDVEGVRLVLGVGEGRVALLHQGAAPAPAEGSTVAPATTMPPRFADIVNKALGR